MAKSLYNIIYAAAAKLQVSPIEGCLTVSEDLERALPQVEAVAELLSACRTLLYESEEITAGKLCMIDTWNLFSVAFQKVAGLKAFNHVTGKPETLSNFVDWDTATSADTKEARFKEAGDQKILGKSKHFINFLDDLAGSLAQPVVKLREQARESAIAGKPCDAAADNLIADQNEEWADNLRKASAHMQSLEELRDGSR